MTIRMWFFNMFGFLSDVLFFSWVREVQKRRKCLLPGASENNLKMLLLAVRLAQMDTQIKSFLCKTDAQQHFESAKSLHIFYILLNPPVPLFVLSSQSLSDLIFWCLVLSTDDQFWTLSWLTELYNILKRHEHIQANYEIIFRRMKQILTFSTAVIRLIWYD